MPETSIKLPTDITAGYTVTKTSAYTLSNDEFTSFGITSYTDRCKAHKAEGFNATYHYPPFASVSLSNIPPGGEPSCLAFNLTPEQAFDAALALAAILTAEQKRELTAHLG